MGPSIERIDSYALTTALGGEVWVSAVEALTLSFIKHNVAIIRCSPQDSSNLNAAMGFVDTRDPPLGVNSPTSPWSTTWRQPGKVVLEHRLGLPRDPRNVLGTVVDEACPHLSALTTCIPVMARLRSGLVKVEHGTCLQAFVAMDKVARAALAAVCRSCHIRLPSYVFTPALDDLPLRTGIPSSSTLQVGACRLLMFAQGCAASMAHMCHLPRYAARACASVAGPTELPYLLLAFPSLTATDHTLWVSGAKGSPTAHAQAVRHVSRHAGQLAGDQEEAPWQLLQEGACCSGLVSVMMVQGVKHEARGYISKLQVCSPPGTSCSFPGPGKLAFHCSMLEERLTPELPDDVGRDPPMPVVLVQRVLVSGSVCCCPVHLITPLTLDVQFDHVHVLFSWQVWGWPGQECALWTPAVHFD